MLVVVKYVVKEILPHFQETFKSGDWGKLGRNRGVCNISGSRTGLMLQLPKQARYQLRYTRIRETLYRISREKAIEISSGFAFWDGGWYNRRKRRDDAWKRGVSFARRS